MEMKMMNDVTPLFGINQQFDYKWDDQVQEFLNQYENNEDYIPEFIDGLVPINFTDIWDVAWAYDLGHLALGIEHATGHTIYELFQHEIAKIYHDEFAEAYYRWTRHEEE
tara:strand:- start:120 stop:449 length:330 start_codon:yes stop_codon:yes gene_type:complete